MIQTLEQFSSSATRDDLVICGGGDCKALQQRGRVAGYALRFREFDVQGDEFAPDVDTNFEGIKTLGVFFHHGLGRFGKSRIGTATLEKREDGIFATAELNLDTPGGKFAWEEAQAGRLGFSTGSVDRLVVRERRDDGKATIKSWPLVELSVSTNPVAGKSTRVVAIKSLATDPFLRRAAVRKPEVVSPLDRLQVARRARGNPRPVSVVSSPVRAIKAMSPMNTFDGVDIKSWSGDFENVRDFIECVIGRGPRLTEYENDVKALGLNTENGPDGGVLVPPSLATDIWRQSLEQRFLPIAYAKRQTTDKGVANYRIWNPADAQADGSRFGGLRSYWIREGQQTTYSKPSLRYVSHKLAKRVVDIAVSDALNEDAGPNLDVWLRDIVSEELAWVTSDQMIRGGGAGEMLGVLRAGCLVTQAAAGTASGAIVGVDLQKMPQRLPSASRGRAAWFYHPTIESQLFDAAAAEGLLRFRDPEAVGTSAVYATIGGLPAFSCELCEVAGTAGDLILGDFGQYALTTKNPSLKFVTSMHVLYLSGEKVLRWQLRIDGRPMWPTTRTPYKGSETQSPFVVLNASRG